MKQKIAVAISGGIDSLITAYLLKHTNKDVIGLHFITGYEKNSIEGQPPKSQPVTDAHLSNSYFRTPHPINKISEQIDIPIKLVDCRPIFKKKIVDYFTETYLSGRTPNPCVICNPLIKFGVLMDVAKNIGASHLATGHYARVETNNNRVFILKKGKDSRKDQSYFLSLLTQKQLAYANFPLGAITKKEVFSIAQKNKIQPISRSESQDICFIKNNNYVDFIALQEGFHSTPGSIIDNHGNILGSHKGLHKYTVGQRRGLNCPAKEPYYVLKIDNTTNQVIVGFKNNLYRSQCVINNVNWIPEKLNKELQVTVKIRYRHSAAKAFLYPAKNNKATIKFKKPQPAITPGQLAVCYIDDKIIAAGWIDE